MGVFSCAKCQVLEAENKRLWSYILSMRSVTIVPQASEVPSIPRPPEDTAKPEQSFRRSTTTVHETVHTEE
jgi:hypothetical protein